MRFFAPKPASQERHRVLRQYNSFAAYQTFSICTLAGLTDTSALFRHEVAYCLGQRQDPAAVNTLIEILDNSSEHPMYVYTEFRIVKLFWQRRIAL